jgi:hypothetical protein
VRAALSKPVHLLRRTSTVSSTASLKGRAVQVDINDDLVDGASKIWIATGWVLMVAAILTATSSLLILTYSIFFA